MASIELCRSCGVAVGENYCPSCGIARQNKKITLGSLIHEFFHLFTHLDKGFLFTLRSLVTAPGNMQRDYIVGNRWKYHKPFATFFICLTALAIGRYLITRSLLYIGDDANMAEEQFLKDYMVIIQLGLMPVHILITWLFFKRSGYNFAETGVMLLYVFSFLCIGAFAISFLRFAWPDMDSALVELPMFMIYYVLTVVNFYHFTAKWKIGILGIISFVVIFFSIQFTEDILKNILEI
ncbi:MAG: DUF3667 domain-containing protein [Chitinophagaceae bacterium]|nr:MAG: DUF3667 domain-containing protein [Chitinophagaceae bacterium]